MVGVDDSSLQADSQLGYDMKAWLQHGAVLDSSVEPCELSWLRGNIIRTALCWVV